MLPCHAVAGSAPPLRKEQVVPYKIIEKKLKIKREEKTGSSLASPPTNPTISYVDFKFTVITECFRS